MRLGDPPKSVGRVLLALTGAGTLLAACSTPSTTTTPPLPTDWKTVTYLGTGIDVPSSWTVKPWVSNCETPSPIVYVGPETPNGLPCPAIMTGAAEVVLGSLPFSGSHPSARWQTINGMTASVVTEPQKVTCGKGVETIVKTWVTLPSKGFTISISVADSLSCPGGGPEIATQIQGSIHIAR